MSLVLVLDRPCPCNGRTRDRATRRVPDRDDRTFGLLARPPDRSSACNGRTIAGEPEFGRSGGRSHNHYGCSKITKFDQIFLFFMNFKVGQKNNELGLVVNFPRKLFFPANWIFTRKNKFMIFSTKFEVIRNTPLVPTKLNQNF